MKRRGNKKAFSLMEITIVVVVLGVLVSIALPRYLVTVEKMKSQEGTQTLLVLLAAQKRNFIDTGSYKDGSGLGNQLASGDLDVSIPTLKNFNPPKIYNNSTKLAEITRLGSAYTLSIDSAGSLQCSSTPASLCAKMGY